MKGNLKEVLMQKDLLDGLKYCVSQFDLIYTFPLYGLPLRLKRYAGSETNPWKTEINYVGVP